MSELVDPETGRPLSTPEGLEKATEEVRARLVTRPRSGQVKTPDSVVDDLQWSRWGASRMVRIVRDADETRRALRHVLEQAKARARMATTAKSADQRDAEVVLATEAEQTAYDAAEVAYEYARSTARMAEGNQSAIQTIAKQVEITYRLAGTGRES